MTNTMIYRKKAAKRIEQALPAGQGIRYQNLGPDNILSIYLPAYKHQNSPQQRLMVSLEVNAIAAWDTVEEADMDSDRAGTSITIVFK